MGGAPGTTYRFIIEAASTRGISVLNSDLPRAVPLKIFGWSHGVGDVTASAARAGFTESPAACKLTELDLLVTQFVPEQNAKSRSNDRQHSLADAS